jgi:hypothetical protein
VRLAMSSAKQGLLLGSLQLVLLGLYLGHVRYEDKPHDVNTIWPSKYDISTATLQIKRGPQETPIGSA